MLIEIQFPLVFHDLESAYPTPFLSPAIIQSLRCYNADISSRLRGNRAGPEI